MWLELREFFSKSSQFCKVFSYWKLWAQRPCVTHISSLVHGLAHSRYAIYAKKMNEWKIRQYLSKLTPLHWRYEGLINIDQDLEMKMETKCEPGMALSMPNLHIFIKVQWLTQGHWNSNLRTKSKNFPCLMQCFTLSEPLSLFGAKKSIIISYSYPWVLVFSSFNNQPILEQDTSKKST